ncbi:MAG: Txe/YoeB family addiction module toxin [Kiritimatiellaeota bacterium]|nr:Txe/YoeB family addiction module toxin [Kiritimatiellota bacterium]
MNKALAFKNEGFEDYLYWQAQDRKTLKRINLLFHDIDRNGHAGIGKPEPLRHNLQGWWSRRIDDEHRLVYRIEGNEIHILSCRFHYDTKH